MQLSNQPEFTVSSHRSNTASEQIPAQYRGWLISTKMIKKKLWLFWQHPLDSSPRYGCPVTETDIASTISQVQSFIDLAIKLEEGALERQLTN